MTEPTYTPLEKVVPKRFLAVCELCNGTRGGPVDIRADGTFQRISGWAMNRTGGGAHGISLPEREPRYAHRHCVEERARGHAGQTSMF